MITERHMALGSWSLKLKAHAPTAIRRAFSQWGANIFVTQTHPGDAAITYAGLKSLASFRGITTRRSEGLTQVGGPGILGMLQTQQGHAGAAANAPSFAAPKTFTQIIQAWLPGTVASNGLIYGSSFSPTATTVTGIDPYTYFPPTKPKLDEVAAQTGNEYRANADGTVDYGVATSLFVTTPVVLIAPKFRGREGTITALNVKEWHPREDLDQYRNYGSVRTSDGLSANQVAASSPVTFFRLDSTSENARFYSEYVSIDTTDATDRDNQALAIANQYAQPNRDYSACDVREFHIPRLATPGDYVYIYDLDSDIYDTANQILFGGGPMFPRKARLLGYTYPLEPPNGVFAYYNDVVTDGTDYIEWETGETTSLMLESAERKVISVPSRKLNNVA